MQQDIREFIVRFKQLDTLPSVALQIIETAGNGEARFRDLKRIIESDPALAARILQAANSALLGFPGQVDSLDHAVSILGFDMVRNWALAMVASSLFAESPNHLAVLDPSELWYHSLACGLAADLLAQKLNQSNRNLAFLTGLLHDLGKIAFFHWNASAYDEAVRRSKSEKCSLDAVERELFEIDHAELGAELLRDWNLPDSICDGIENHHRVDYKNIGRLSGLIHTANSICHLKQFGACGNFASLPGEEVLLRETGLETNDLDEITGRVLLRINDVGALFDVHGSSRRLYISAVSRANRELSDMYRQLANREREQKETANELKKREEQLARSQRLEAIGQLAGGIAHDFNNFLTVVMGSGSLLRKTLREVPQAHKHVETILTAAEKAAGLTRQLLAFSRRQVLEPTVLSLNTVITEIEDMLGPLIGENISLSTTLDPDLWPIYVDPGGIEQVILNLAVNARDAMENGGTLRFHTKNVTLTEEDCRKYVAIKPGNYVRFTVSDTGPGICPSIQERIFEPFFTTKKKGTGLGLATVYGIIKQSGGYIFVDSRSGRGATLRIFFEPSHNPIKPKPTSPIAKQFQAGSGVILVAEDEEQLLHLIAGFLDQAGYMVLTARNGADAIQVAGRYPGRIDLLLTDIVMPDLNGRELAQKIQPDYPKMKVILMSGYPSSVLPIRPQDDPYMAFLPKPFTPDTLLCEIQRILSRRD